MGFKGLKGIAESRTLVVIVTVALWDSKDNAVDIVPLVKYVIANGNTTTFQWRTNKVPSRVEEPTLDYLTGEDEDEKENEAEEVELCT